jgi:phosphomannomutase
MRKIGTAAAQYLRAEFSRSPNMVVGCDGRESSRNLARVFCEGANAGGLHTLQIGTSTPAMAHFVLGTRKQGSAAFITGCQADANVNGVRLYRHTGVPLTFETGLDKVGLIARRLKPGRSKAPGRDASDDVLEEYRSYVAKFVPRLQEIKVAVDGSCGAPGRVLPFVLSKLPTRVVRSHTEPDRRSALLGQPHPSQQVDRSLRERMRSASCQVGIAVDYDGDMCAFYDEDGRRLRNDVAAALIAREMLHRMPGARIAYDLRFTAAVREEILRVDGRPHRAASDPLALARATRQQEAVYAASMDGRHFFRDMFGAESPTLALLMMCSLLSRSEESLSSLADGVARYAYSGQIRYGMPSTEATEKAMEDVKDEFREADRDSIDGLTYRFTDWWFNLRQPPRTASLMLTVEGRDQQRMRRGRKRVDQILKRHGAETL